MKRTVLGKIGNLFPVLAHGCLQIFLMDILHISMDVPDFYMDTYVYIDISMDV
jgi:hypothetical protein